MNLFYPTLRVCSVLLIGLVLSSVAQSDSAILIDPIIGESVSGRDDLELMRGLFREATWISPIPALAWSKLQLLSVKKVRIFGVENKNMVLKNTTGWHYDFSSIKDAKALKDCRAYGLIPHIIVGHAPQVAFSTSKMGDKYYGVSNWAAYSDYAYAFLRAIMVDNGFTEVDFEVGNEPDINGEAWLLAGAHANNDPSMYAAYFNLYRAWAVAAARLARERHDLKLRIGGPSVTAYYLNQKRKMFNWAEHFIGDVSKQRLRLDFLSFHVYGNNQALVGMAEFGVYPTLASQIESLRATLRAHELGNVPLFMSEWGPSWHSDETGAGIVNGNYVGAAWAARLMFTVADQNLDEAALLVFRDINTPAGDGVWGWPSLFLADHVTSKAMYNVASLLSRMSGHRVKVSPGLKGSIGVIAASDTSKVSVLLFNQDWDFVNGVERAQTRTIRLIASRLPFPAVAVWVTRHLVDQTHGDPYALRVSQPTAALRDMPFNSVGKTEVPVMNGAVQLPPLDLPPSSVTLIEIEESGSGNSDSRLGDSLALPTAR